VAPHFSEVVRREVDEVRYHILVSGYGKGGAEAHEEIDRVEVGDNQPTSRCKAACELSNSLPEILYVTQYQATEDQIIGNRSVP
jgi:hypothetical protein